MLEDRELLAYIGRIVVDAALLEYTVAKLVATAEGLRGQEREDRALAIIRTTGEAMRAFGRLAEARPEFRWLHGDTGSVLRGRNFIAHAVAQEPAVTGDGEAALFILAPRADEPETMVTLSQLVSQTRLLSDSRDLVEDNIDAELSGRPYRPRYRFPQA